MRGRLALFYLTPPHEVLKREVDSHPELLEDFRQRMREGPWLPAFEEHPTVMMGPEVREVCLPIALYMDGAAHGKRDEILIFTVRILNSHKRNLAFTFQKSLLCSCGCGGWCTMYYCFSVLHWSLQALMRGVYPATGWDGSPLDSERQKLAGTPLGFRGVVVDVNGDWAEFAVRWGFPTWQSNFRPCLACDCNHVQMLDPMHVMSQHAGDAYENACHGCEIWVGFTSEAQHSAVKLALMDDSTRKGMVLRKDIDVTVPSLRRSDRLEPCPSLPNIADFPFQRLPFTCKFWRIPANAVIVHHRNPLIDRELGTSTKTFSGDILHTNHLGIYPMWMTRALWVLFQVDAFQSRCSRAEDHLRHNAITLQALVTKWYPSYEATLSEKSKRGMTRVSGIYPSLLGKADFSSVVGFKAAECKHFCPFVLELVRKYKVLLLTVPTLDFDALEGAGQALLDWTRIVDSQPRMLTDAVADQLEHLMDLHVRLAAKAGVKMMPKHHAARCCFSICM